MSRIVAKAGECYFDVWVELGVSGNLLDAISVHPDVVDIVKTPEKLGGRIRTYAKGRFCRSANEKPIAANARATQLEEEIRSIIYWLSTIYPEWGFYA